jgi:release factor glutamine methyltransferase
VKEGWEILAVLEVLQKAEGYLLEKGCPTPRLDAQVLLAHVLSTERVQLYVDHARPLNAEELSSYRRLVSKRARHEPVAYLVGEKEFWSLPIRVDPRVLIPRPDTETILEAILDLYPDGKAPRAFADVGTGSGCLLCALAGMFPDARGVGVDSDPKALLVARDNLERLGFRKRAELRRGNLIEPLAGEKYELVCANLPYIPTGELLSLPPDIRLYEPLLALDGGPDGLEPIRTLIQQASRFLGCGALVLEVGDGQASSVSDLCAAAGFSQVCSRRDLAGTERVIVAKRPGM